MQVTVKVVEDDGEATEVTVDLGQWPAMAPALRLLVSVVDYSLARVFLHCVSAGINVFLQEYGASMQAIQLDNFRERAKRAYP